MLDPVALVPPRRLRPEPHCVGPVGIGLHGRAVAVETTEHLWREIKEPAAEECFDTYPSGTHLMVKAPKGWEVGYVPIAIGQLVK